MTSVPHPPGEEPELVPPAELLRLRAMLVRAPEPATRARHLAAITAAAREGRTSGHAGRFARRGVRVAAAVVASLAITSGLAGAQLLPQPAQRLLSSVGDRFSPDEAPPADPGATGGHAGAGSDGPARDAAAQPSSDQGRSADGDGDTTASEAPASSSTTTPPTSAPTTTEPPTSTTTTIPGPVGPGSPDDPTDPVPTDGGTDGGSSGGSTDGGTAGGPTDGGSGGMGTTEIPPEGPTTTMGGPG